MPYDILYIRPPRRRLKLKVRDYAVEISLDTESCRWYSEGQEIRRKMSKGTLGGGGGGANS